MVRHCGSLLTRVIGPVALCAIESSPLGAPVALCPNFGLGPELRFGFGWQTLRCHQIRLRVSAVKIAVKRICSKVLRDLLQTPHTSGCVVGGCLSFGRASPRGCLSCGRASPMEICVEESGGARLLSFGIREQARTNPTSVWL